MSNIVGEGEVKWSIKLGRNRSAQQRGERCFLGKPMDNEDPIVHSIKRGDHANRLVTVVGEPPAENLLTGRAIVELFNRQTHQRGTSPGVIV